jgi:serine kinase of HPr protein (carbohydrate metabolism regulator)
VSDTVHASAVVVGDHGVLIRGASSSGKSSLVLAVLSARPRIAVLVADDRVALSVADGRLVAAAPAELAGLLEIRGQGIVRRPHVSPAFVDLVVDLLPLEQCPRLPEPDQARTSLEGVVLPRLALPVGAADGAIRLLARVDDLDVTAVSTTVVD